MSCALTCSRRSKPIVVDIAVDFDVTGEAGFIDDGRDPARDGAMNATSHQVNVSTRSAPSIMHSPCDSV